MNKTKEFRFTDQADSIPFPEVILTTPPGSITGTVTIPIASITASEVIQFFRINLVAFKLAKQCFLDQR